PKTPPEEIPAPIRRLRRHPKKSRASRRIRSSRLPIFMIAYTNYGSAGDSFMNFRKTVHNKQWQAGGRRAGGPGTSRMNTPHGACDTSKLMTQSHPKAAQLLSHDRLLN